MSMLQRIGAVFRGLFTLMLAVILLVDPEDGFYVVLIILSASLFLYGVRKLIFYFSMARHMVGGKATLYQAVLLIDIALSAFLVVAMGNLVILIYLLFFFAFSGVVDILRALESKRMQAPSWKLKLFGGVVQVAFIGAVAILSIFFHKSYPVVFGYALTLIFSAATRIASAFRKTSIVYIQ